MAYILASRLVTRRLLGFQTTCPLFGIGSRSVKKRQGAAVDQEACVQQIFERPGETHDDKNFRIGRPLSPHLTVYKIQLNSVMSITHRLTGTIGGVYLMIFAANALYLPYNLCEVCEYIECMNPPSIVIWFCRAVLSFPYVYHTCNGLRHLSWDLGKFFTLAEIFNGGLAMLGMITIAMIIVVFVL